MNFHIRESFIRHTFFKESSHYGSHSLEFYSRCNRWPDGMFRLDDITITDARSVTNRKYDGYDPERRVVADDVGLWDESSQCGGRDDDQVAEQRWHDAHVDG